MFLRVTFHCVQNNGRQWVPLILFSTTWQTMSSLALLDKMAQHCVRTIAMEEAVSTIYLLGVLSVNITTNSYRHGSLWSFMPFLLLPSSFFIIIIIMCLFLATQLNTHVHCQHVHSQKQIIIHPRKNGINQIRISNMATRAQVNVFNVEGKQKGQTAMPFVFSAPNSPRRSQLRPHERRQKQAPSILCQQIGRSPNLC